MTKVTVFGANGSVGRLVVTDLLEYGHEVTAFVHGDHELENRTNLHIISGDIHDEVQVEQAIEGADVVISTLGSWGTVRKDILRVGMVHIISAMKKFGITRIISLTGSEARARGDKFSGIHRFAHVGAGLLAGDILEDAEDHIRQLEKSGLEWTVLRSPLMVDEDSTHYRLGRKRPPPWKTIGRSAVARAIVEQLDDIHHYHRSPFINR